MNMIWHFPSTGGGSYEGINNAGVEHFSDNKERNVVRECIQNSIDARVDYSKPVRVEFSVYSIDSHEIPGYSELEKIMKAAKALAVRISGANDRSAKRFYDEALECLGGRKVNILRVGDYNTAGLTGGDTEEDNPGGWYHLVRSSGTSYKEIEGGGSFGIGKSAPFAASSIRAVFYSTMLKDGSVAFQGKAMLSSYKDTADDMRRAEGQYGIEQRKPGVASVRQLSAIPHIFRRTEQGTDVFIVGYQKVENWLARMVEATIENFYVAIHENELEVVLKADDEEVVISSQTMSDVIDRYVDNEEILWFYRTLVDEGHKYFVEEVEGLGKVEMYIRLGEGKRCIQGMRQTLMKIHEFKLRKPLTEDFTGIVIVRGDEGNGLLRNLEPPTHDEWQKGRGDAKSKEARKQLEDWIRGRLGEIAGESKAAIEEIPDLSKYLPQDMLEDENDPVFSQNGYGADGDNPNETADERNMTQDGSAVPTIGIRDRSATIAKPGTSGGEKKKLPKNKGKGARRKRGKGADEPDGDTRYADSNSMDVRVKETSTNGRRTYLLIITPEKDDSGDIRIIGRGDGKDYPLEISSAYLDDGTALVTEGADIKNLSFMANKPINISVELKSSRRYIVGVA